MNSYKLLKKVDTYKLDLIWSKNNYSLACYDPSSNTISVWNVENNTELLCIEKPSTNNTLIFWNLDDRKLICTGNMKGKSKYFIDIESSDISEILCEIEYGPIILFNDGQSGIHYHNKEIQLFKVIDSEWTLKKSDKVEDFISGLFYTQITGLIACCYLNGINIYDINLNLISEIKYKFAFVDGFITLVWAPDGKSIFFGDDLGNLIQWHVEKHKTLFQRQFIIKADIKDIEYDPDKAEIFYDGESFFSDFLDDFENPSKDSLVKAVVNKNCCDCNINDIKLHPSGNYLAFAPHYAEIIILKIPENKIFHRISSLKKSAWNIAWSSDGRFLAVFEGLNSLNIWDSKGIL